MKTTVLYSALVLAITGGCATQAEKPAWEIRPTMGVRHGMRAADAHYQLGRYYRGQNRLREAERAFQRALGEDDRHIGALNELGALYASQGDLAKALTTFRHVETLASDQAYLHNNLGFALLLQGKHDEALEQLKHAVTLDPGYERAWVNLGELAKRRGDAELAHHVAQRSFVATIRRADGPREHPAGDLPVARAEPAPTLLMSTALAAPPTGLPEPSNIADAGVTAVRESKASTNSMTKPTQAVAISNYNALRIQPVKWPDGAPAVGESPIRTLDLEPALGAKVDPVRPLHLEVSNGNGIRRFATRFGSMLNGLGMPVSRVTNHSTYSVEGTVIEYKPGFEAAAADLNERLNLKARLVERKAGSMSSDVKLVLGRDLARRAALLS